MDSFSSHPFLSDKERLVQLGEDIAHTRLCIQNYGASEFLTGHLDKLCKARLVLLFGIEHKYGTLPAGVVETAVEDCDLYDMRDYNDVTPQAGSAAI